MGVRFETDREFADLVDPAHTALIVIDVQNDACHPDGVFARLGRDISLRQGAAHRVKAFVENVRPFGVPVVFTQGVQEDGDQTPWWYRRNKSDSPPPYRLGTWGAELYAVEPRPEDTVLVKRRASVFVGTDLEETLKRRGVGTLLLTGGATNACVEATAWHADMLDFDVVVVADCCGTPNPAEQEVALQRIADRCGIVVQSSDVIDAWQASAAGRPPGALAAS